MIEIGGRPIIWHIMKLYSHYGVNEFVICLGYRGYMIKEYFSNYLLHSSDVTVNLGSNATTFHNNRSEPWEVTLVDTGTETQTGGRISRVRPYLDSQEAFFLTYGDGLADIAINSELQFHLSHGRLVTMTLVHPPARFGGAVVDGDRIAAFEEKPQASEGLINGGFFVVSPEALDLIDGDETPWETTPLQKLVAMDELRGWKHTGFWQPMDTLREKELLEAIWENDPPWKVWT